MQDLAAYLFGLLHLNVGTAALVSTCLLFVSEILGGMKSINGNGIVQVIINFLKGGAVALKAPQAPVA